MSARDSEEQKIPTLSRQTEIISQEEGSRRRRKELREDASPVSRIMSLFLVSNFVREAVML